MVDFDLALFDVIFICLLFGIPIVLFIVSMFFYHTRRTGIINKLNYSRYSSKGISINNKNLFIEYNHMWRLIKNIEHATLNVLNLCKKEKDEKISGFLDGIIDEIKSAGRSKSRLAFKGHATRLLYMHRTLKRIQHLFSSTDGVGIPKETPEFTYLRNLIDCIDEYIFREHVEYLEVNASDYIEARIDPTIMLFNNKTLAASILFTCFSIIQIVYSALIPVSLLISHTPNTTIIGALYGACLTIASSINAFCKFKEKWVQYHELRDKLLIERNIYISDYSHKDYVHFVEACEKIISREHKNLTEVLSNVDTPAKRKPEESD